MSESKHSTDSHSKEEHGSAKSYIIGFVLSLIFTAIPYYLVVQKIISGSSLLATILGIAVIQMAIQIFFFLHLGRGPKPLYNVIFFVSTVGIILVVVFGSIFIMDNLQYSMTPEEAIKKLAQKEGISQVNGETTGACKTIGTNHKVIIRNGKAEPVRTSARLCDRLTFINEDVGIRDISFGPHPNHDDYSGEEVSVSNSRSKSITLNEAGEFLFHDHLDPAMGGYFTVTP